MSELTDKLIDDFAEAVKAKLSEAEKKYGYSDNWARDDWMDECREKLTEHVVKGDPRDVAAYCAFLWYHNEKTGFRITEQMVDKAAEAFFNSGIDDDYCAMAEALYVALNGELK